MKEPVSYIEKILTREIENKECIYLYEENGEWCAYERSAYYLLQLNAPVQLEKEIISGYEVILVKATIPYTYIYSSETDIKLKRFGGTDAEYRLSTKINGFSEWKASQLNVLSA